MKLKIPELEQLLQHQMTGAQIPRAALAIVQTDTVVYANGFDVTNVEERGPAVTPQMLFGGKKEDNLC